MEQNYVTESVEMNNNCKIYEGAQVKRCIMGNCVVIGEDSYVTNTEIGNYVQINRRNQIDDAVIGERSFTGANTVLRHVDIGKYTSISWNVSLGGCGRHHPERLSIHPFTQLKQFGLVDKNEPIDFPRSRFGNDVWIGMDATIIAGVTIGDGAIIGAGSVVTKDVPPYAISVGSPARVYRMRFSDKIIDSLLQIRWWDWPEELLKRNIELFRRPLKESDLEKLADVMR